MRKFLDGTLDMDCVNLCSSSLFSPNLPLIKDCRSSPRFLTIALLSSPS